MLRGDEMNEGIRVARETTMKAMGKVVDIVSEIGDPCGVAVTVQTVFGVAVTIYEQVQKVKANKVRAYRLAERISNILVAIQGLNELIRENRFMPLLEKFEAHLSECQAFIEELGSKGWARRFFLAGAYDEQFSDLNINLDEIRDDLGLGMKAELIYNQEQERRDREQDQRDLCGRMDEIVALQKEHKYGLEKINKKISRTRISVVKDIEKLLAAQIESIKLTLETSSTVRGKYEDGIDPHVIIPFHQIEFGDVIKRGLFTTIYLGSFRGESVAVKSIEGEISDREREQFKREVQIMSRLRHRHITNFYGVCVGEKVALIMEHMEEGSLHDLLKRGLLAPEQQKRIALDIAKGLRCLHNNSPIVLHRDLKSANVLIDERGIAKLTDFGLSKIHTTSVQTISERKTDYRWMPPELFDPHGRYTQSSDIYSYGVILWEIVTGREPCPRIPEGEIERYVMTGQREKEVDMSIPEVYANIIRRCWVLNPKDRPKLSDIIEQIEGYQLRPQSPSGEELYSSGLKYWGEKNYDQAKQMYERSVKKGFVKAYTNLGLFYLQSPRREDQDTAQAFHFIKTGAEQGHARAQFILGDMYESGIEVEKDLLEARSWYKKAAKKGDGNAQKKLNEIEIKIKEWQKKHHAKPRGQYQPTTNLKP